MAHINAMGNVEKSGTHLRWKDGKNIAAYNNHNYIIMSLEDVGRHYSLPVMFHVFPVGKEEKTQQSRITDMTHIIGACEKECDSLPEVGGRKEQQHNITTTITSQCH